MAAPKTTDAFLTLLRKSGLVDDECLETCMDRNGANPQVHATPADLARDFVQREILTQFQARRLLRGKRRGYFLGNYRVLKPIGSGAMGRVFLAEHRVMRRRVALKLLRPGRVSEPGALQRWQREAQAGAAFDHPNVVRAYDIGEDAGRHFLVLEYVEGVSLEELVARRGALLLARAADCVRQAARGLEHAHHAGWVHRDVKPGNLLLDRNGVVKILDMGLARLVRGQQVQLTRRFDARNVLGTADYLAPEQVLDSHKVDARADIYSLGCTLYFLLTGSAPFEERSLTGKLFGHQVGEPKPLCARQPGLPVQLVAVVDKMMAKHPSKRFQRMEEVHDALAVWSGDSRPLSLEELQSCPEGHRENRLAQAGRQRSSTQAPLTAVLSSPSDSVPSPAKTDRLVPEKEIAGLLVSKSTLAPDVAGTRVTKSVDSNGRTTERPFGTIPNQASSDPIAGNHWTWRTLAVAWVILAVVLSAAVSWVVFIHAETLPNAPIPANHAIRHAGERRTVLLHVNSAESFGSPPLVYLHSDSDNHREGIFTAVIVPQAVQQLENELNEDPKNRFLGKDVLVTGAITLHEGRPHIMIDDPLAIQVAKE